MKKLNKDLVLEMHKELIKQTGGEIGLRDESSLISALETPFQTFDGADLYRTVQEKAARLAYGIIANHPFVDGNKRIGILAMLVFLELNNIYLHYTNEELVELGLGVASSKLDKNHILNFILSH